MTNSELEGFKKALYPFKTKPNSKPVFRLIHSESRNKILNWTAYVNFLVLHEHQMHNLLKYFLSPYLTKKDGIFLHCSAIMNFDKSVTLFLGDSGSGKSTISDFLHTVSMKVADDIAIIRLRYGKPLMFSTPFLETHKSESISGGLHVKSIYFLKKGKQLVRKRMSNMGEIIKKLHSQLWVHEKMYNSQLRIFLELAKKPSYILQFPKDRIRVLKEFISFSKER